MGDVSLEVEPAAGQFDYVCGLLAANDLPTADVEAKPECFVVARREGERVGVGGLEVRGDVGVLRSVAIEREARGDGCGRALCARLEAVARERGVGALYLLTTTAAPFFAGLGYEAIDRASVPAAIRATEQFDELCPDSATCMAKEL